MILIQIGLMMMMMMVKSIFSALPVETQECLSWEKLLSVCQSTRQGNDNVLIVKISRLFSWNTLGEPVLVLL